MKKKSLFVFLLSLALIFPIFAPATARHHSAKEADTYQTQSEAVNLNTADATQLTTLKGIGKKRHTAYGRRSRPRQATTN